SSVSNKPSSKEFDLHALPETRISLAFIKQQSGPLHRTSALQQLARELTNECGSITRPHDCIQASFPAQRNPSRNHGQALAVRNTVQNAAGAVEGGAEAK